MFINHDASRTSNDCYVCEIGPGEELVAQRQLYEEMIMILSGRGSTTVWNDAGQKVSFEWQAGALFAIPVNAWHQHFNGSGDEKVRFVAVTNLPPIMNVYEEPEFIFDVPEPGVYPGRLSRSRPGSAATARSCQSSASSKRASCCRIAPVV